jgi:hypothetical protein
MKVMTEDDWREKMKLDMAAFELLDITEDVLFNSNECKAGFNYAAVNSISPDYYIIHYSRRPFKDLEFRGKIEYFQHPSLFDPKKYMEKRVAVWDKNPDVVVFGILKDIRGEDPSKYGCYGISVASNSEVLYYNNIRPLTPEELLKEREALNYL